MKRFLLLSFLSIGVAYAQYSPCYTTGIYKSTVTAFSTSDTSKTLVTAPAGYDVHVCTIKFVLPEAHTVELQGSDNSIIDGPDPLIAAGSYFVSWNGQLDTTKITLTPSTTVGIKLTLNSTPSAAFGVTLIYYLVQR